MSTPSSSPSTSSIPRLLQPIKVGKIQPQHRIVVAPTTRLKAYKSRLPVLSLVTEHYTQRSSTPGTLIIGEGMFIDPYAGSFSNAPGIWASEQAKAWKEIHCHLLYVTDAVHKQGSFIFAQLWAEGRAVDPSLFDSDGKLVAPSPIPLFSSPNNVSHKLSVDEIKQHLQLYVEAAKKAVFEAGFDGVEVHGANGYLVDQFLQDNSNRRTDRYGGSIENRSRFPLEIVSAIANAIGEERTAIRISPWSTFQDMRMEDPIPQFSHFVSTLGRQHPSLAYLHIIEPRITGAFDAQHYSEDESNDFIRAIWGPKVLISAGGYSRDAAILRAEKNSRELVAFGRYFISNPDLPYRIQKNIAFNKYDRKTFYVPGDSAGTERGYLDYPFAEGNERRPLKSVGSQQH